MRIIKPEDVTVDTLTATNVPADDYPAWAAGTYAEGDRVIDGIEAYESLTANNTDTIEAGLAATPPTWLRLGFINRWKMFRDGRDSKTRQDGGITVQLTPGIVTNGIALLGMEGLEVDVTMTDPTEGVVFDRTFVIRDIGVTNIWDYFFLPYGTRSDFVALDLPPYDAATIEIDVRTSNPGDTSAAGRVLLGVVRDLGTTDHDLQVRWINFSDINRNPFGDLQLTKRRRVKLVTYPITVERANSDFAISELDSVTNELSVFVGDEDVSASITFGIPRRPQVTFSNPAVTDMSIEVEEF